MRSFPVGTRAAVVLLLAMASSLRPAQIDSVSSPDDQPPVLLATPTPQTPQIALSSVPPYGGSGLLQGSVSGVDPSSYAVAVYAQVPPAGWSNRPATTAPVTKIDAKGTWTCNIAASDNGQYAIGIIAFLIPASYQPPVVTLAEVLPADLYNHPHAEAIRYPRLQFANCEWMVKRVHDLISPGPNYFSDNPENLWLDNAGRLHLKMTQRSGQWYCSEVFLEQSLGYGRYAMTVAGGLKGMDRNAVLDLFTWNDSLPDKNYGEMDVEFSRWGDANTPNTRFMVQPWYNTGNMQQFELDPTHDPNGMTTHEIVWDAGQVSFRSYYGAFALHPPAGRLVSSWSYKGANLPAAGSENLHVSLWLLAHLPPSDGKPVEFTISDVTYLPADPNAVYRFWSPVTLGHFYTSSEAEKAKLLRDFPGTWTYEGIAFWALTKACHPNLAPVHRFWSAQLADHFYTIDEAEKNKLMSQSAGVWTYEGIAFYAWPDGRQPPGTCPVYRFWSSVTTSHFYTADESEKARLLQDPSHLWTYEGIAWHAYSLPGQ